MTAVNLIETVYKTISRHGLLPAGAMLLVGVSGGTDSLALLHLLLNLRDDVRLHDVRLHVATLDHGLRGEVGADDARFVVETAGAWGVPATAGYADVQALAAERGLGIEAAARLARYGFLASVAREIGADRIAVAHNADDQVETVLLHLLRGSGLGGLAGMSYAAPLPDHPDLTLIRPLLDVPRADLEAYCQTNKLSPRHDATNEDTSYTRNRLRRETLPYLRGLAPQFDRRLLQLSEIAALEDDFADKALHDAVDRHVVRGEVSVTVPRYIFAELHPALQRRYIVSAARALDPAGDVGYTHIAAAVKVALESQGGARAQLKRGIQLRIAHSLIVIERESGQWKPPDRYTVPQGLKIPLMIPGTTEISSGWSLMASLTPWEQPGLRLAIPEGTSVIIRGRRNGDRFAPLGLNGHVQKLSKWFIDHGLARKLRDQLPLLVVDDEIAALFIWTEWVISHHFAVRPDSQRVVYFRLNREHPLT